MKYSATEGATLPVLNSQPTLAAGKIWYEGGSLKYHDAVATQVKTIVKNARLKQFQWQYDVMAQTKNENAEIKARLGRVEKMLQSK